MTVQSLRMPPSALVEPDRVHRLCYTDSTLFDLEMERIFERTWIYCGHESQIPNVGDYYTVRIGRQPMIMVRGRERAIHVLYNRCPHRGVELCGSDEGNVGDSFVCPYHAWRFSLDGHLQGIPLSHGYAGTRFEKDGPESQMATVLTTIYRGFVFARLDATGPALERWLGPVKAAIDNLCDRAPDGEVEIVRPRFRMRQHSNWKLFMENQLDTLHAPITHESAARAAAAVETEVKRRTGIRPLEYGPLSAVNVPVERWEGLRTRGYTYGHGTLEAYLPQPDDPDHSHYENLLARRHGTRKAKEVLSSSIHHALIYPCVSIQPALQQLRVIRPLRVDLTLSELWHFRLKGAPESIYQRSLSYFYLINSPSTLVNADDLENWGRAQRGLAANGHDWVSFHRNCGQDVVNETVIEGASGMSEAPMRNQYNAWLQYMTTSGESWPC